MSFCINSETKVLFDIDKALCGECEKPLSWIGRRAHCCGYRYTYWWTSTVRCSRTPLAKRPTRKGRKNR